jgi:hypothetical protein
MAPLAQKCNGHSGLPYAWDWNAVRAICDGPHKQPIQPRVMG